MTNVFRTAMFSLALALATPLAARKTHFEPLGVPDPSAESASIAALLANPQQFDRKPVRVVGAFRLQFETSRICSTQDELVRGPKKHCLSITLDHQRLGPRAETLRSHNNKIVVMEGRFSTIDRGHLGQFPASIGAIWYVSEPSTPVD